MTEREFKEAVWQEKDYLKSQCGYLRDEKFFKTKKENSGTSDDFYIDTEAVKEWAYCISQYYTPYNNDHALLIKDLLELRGGQYSNGTLYSSSRYIAEMFKYDSNRKKLLAQLGLEKYSFENFKWYLEYRLPIFDSEQHTAQLDLAAVNEEDGIFAGVESKMKEIYSNHHNDFSDKYYDLLNNLGKDLFIFSNGSKEYPLRVSIKDCVDLEFCNFYYKQQICHLFGMQKMLQRGKISQCKFVNFVFDISDIPEYADEPQIARYRKNEKEIMNILEPIFKANGITYCGLKTQVDFIEK